MTERVEMMKKFQLKKVNQEDLNERILMINLLITQIVTLFLAALFILIQHRNPIFLLAPAEWTRVVSWGVGFAAAAVVVDFLISHIVPDEVTDDGGINELLFRNRTLWQIVLICFLVAVCEELLFRGAAQHAFGPYWTSILFAAIHVRYLKHWLMTGLVFSLSYGLGWIYDWTGTLWTPILAHFLIDFIMGCIIRYRRK